MESEILGFGIRNAASGPFSLSHMYIKKTIKRDEVSVCLTLNMRENFFFFTLQTCFVLNLVNLTVLYEKRITETNW